MSSYIQASVLSGILLFSALPAMAADSGGVSGASIIDCSSSGLSADYVQNVCKPLQSEVDQLLNGVAQPPKPIVMKDPLDMQQYRASGINAIVQFTKNNNQVNSSQEQPNNPLDDIKLWNLQ